jgi:hypothetical protein
LSTVHFRPTFASEPSELVSICCVLLQAPAFSIFVLRKCQPAPEIELFIDPNNSINFLFELVISFDSNEQERRPCCRCFIGSAGGRRCRVFILVMRMVWQDRQRTLRWLQAILVLLASVSKGLFLA